MGSDSGQWDQTVQAVTVSRTGLFLKGNLTFRPVLTFFSFVGASSLLSVCRCEHATVHIVTVKGQLEGTGLLLPPCVLCVALSSLGLVVCHLYHLAGLLAPAIVSRKEFK